MDYARAAIVGILVGAAAGSAADYVSDIIVPKVDKYLEQEDSKANPKSVIETGLNVALKLTISSGGLYLGDMILDRIVEVDPTQGLYFSFGFMASQFGLLNDVQKFGNALKALLKSKSK